MFKSRQFILFLITGGTAAVVNFLSRFVFELFTPYWLAIFMAYFLGMVIALLLAKKFVFKQGDISNSKSFFYFFVVNILGVLQTLTVSLSLVYYILPIMNYTYYPKTLAHAIGIMVPAFTSFIGHKKLSFRENA